MAADPQTQRRQNWYAQMIIILLGVIAVRLWMIPTDVLPRASAQIPNSGAQRNQLIRAAEHTNALLLEINEQLKQGTLRVTVVEEAKDDAKKTRQ